MKWQKIASTLIVFGCHILKGKKKNIKTNEIHWQNIGKTDTLIQAQTLQEYIMCLNKLLGRIWDGYIITKAIKSYVNIS